MYSENGRIGVISDRYFRVYDATTGAQLWLSARKGAVELHSTSAAIAFIELDDVVVVWDNDQLYAHSLNAKNSKLHAWTQPVPVLSAVVSSNGDSVVVVFKNVVRSLFVVDKVLKCVYIIFFEMHRYIPVPRAEQVAFL